MKKVIFTITALSVFASSPTAFACSDTHYLNSLYSEFQSYVKTTEKLPTGYQEIKETQDFAGRLARLSKNCAENTSSYSSREKMNNIKRLSENLYTYSSDYLRLISSTASDLKSNLEKENYGFLDFLVGLGQVTYNTSEVNAKREQISFTLKEIRKAYDDY